MDMSGLQYAFLTEFMKLIVQKFYEAMPPIGFHSDNVDTPLPKQEVNDGDVGKGDLLGLYLNGKCKELDKATILVLCADGSTMNIPYSDYENGNFWPAASFFVSENFNKSKFNKMVKACVFNGLL